MLCLVYMCDTCIYRHLFFKEFPLFTSGSYRLYIVNYEVYSSTQSSLNLQLYSCVLTAVHISRACPLLLYCCLAGNMRGIMCCFQPTLCDETLVYSDV